MNKISINCCITLLLLTGCSSKYVSDSQQQSVKLFGNLGDHHFPITTDNRLAQRYFDQGIILAYAFNHLESVRSFRQAVRIDPNCAMCYWGIAYALGPNINAPMDDSAVPEAYQSSQQALRLREKITAREKLYINALAQRYTSKPQPGRAGLDKDYADAMRKVIEQYPEDAEAATLLADALMNQHPWDYWTSEGKPKPWAGEIVTALEKALKIAPLHPGANHLYIHAVEASANPERALPSADRLGTLVPGAGHLVHMPAHIYIRTGQYQKAVLANRRAVAIDQNYLDHHHSEGVYTLAYVPHNHHFLWLVATHQGRSAEAIAAAYATADHVDQEAMRQPGMGTLEHYFTMPTYALVRFGKWTELLKQPAPAQDLRYANAIWHYARGMARLAKGEFGSTLEEIQQVKAISREPAIAKMSVSDMNTMSQILSIATTVLEGELAAKKGDLETAITRLRQAVQLEDQLRYNEPSDWYYPVRQSLGAVLLQAGKPSDAELVYREDLKKNRENGWSLFGLRESLIAQNRTAAARDVEQRFEKSWSHADFVLTASRLMDG